MACSRLMRLTCAAALAVVAVLTGSGSASAQTVAVTATILPEMRLGADPVVLSERGVLTVGASPRSQTVQNALTTMTVPAELRRRLNPPAGAGAREGGWTRQQTRMEAQDAERASYVVTWTVVPKGA